MNLFSIEMLENYYRGSASELQLFFSKFQWQWQWKLSALVILGLISFSFATYFYFSPQYFGESWLLLCGMGAVVACTIPFSKYYFRQRKKVYEEYFLAHHLSTYTSDNRPDDLLLQQIILTEYLKKRNCYCKEKVSQIIQLLYKRKDTLKYKYAFPAAAKYLLTSIVGGVIGGISTQVFKMPNGTSPLVEFSKSVFNVTFPGLVMLVYIEVVIIRHFMIQLKEYEYRLLFHLEDLLLNIDSISDANEKEEIKLIETI